MPLLTKRERELLKLELTYPRLTEGQRNGILRELKADDDSVTEGVVTPRPKGTRKK